MSVPLSIWQLARNKHLAKIVCGIACFDVATEQAVEGEAYTAVLIGYWASAGVTCQWTGYPHTWLFAQSILKHFVAVHGWKKSTICSTLSAFNIWSLRLPRHARCVQWRSVHQTWWRLSMWDDDRRPVHDLVQIDKLRALLLRVFCLKLITAHS